MCEWATYGKVVPSRLSHLRLVSCRLKFEVLCKKLKVRSFRTSVGRLTGAGGARRGRDDGRHDCERGMNDGRVGRCAACGGCGWYGRCAGRRGGCGAVLSAPNKKQGCRRQPCSLSVFYGLKPMQFGFFGSLGIFFPKKIPKSGCGAKPRIYIPSCRGAGREATQNPHTCEAQPRISYQLPDFALRRRSISYTGIPTRVMPMPISERTGLSISVLTSINAPPATPIAGTTGYSGTR